MHIVIGTHYFHPHTGGIENVAKQHARRLTKRGHTVTVVSSKLDKESKREYRGGYRILRYRAYNPFERWGIPYPLPHPRSFKRVLSELLVDHSVDVLHLHGLNYLHTSMALALVKPKLPVLLHQHTPFIKYASPVWIAEYLTDRLVGRWNLSQCDQVLCVSEQICDYVRTLDSATNCRKFPNGVDTSRFSPDHGFDPTNTHLPSDVPIFFSLSRMSSKKGVDTIIDASKILSKNNINVKIILAGAGSEMDQVRQEAASLSNIQVTGYISDEMLPMYYAAATGFIFSSKSGEAFPTLTMLEALSSGTPVIATRIDEQTEGINHGRNGLLIPPDDPIQLAQAIQRLAENKDRAEEMGRRARQTAISEFDINQRIKELEKIYNELVTQT